MQSEFNAVLIALEEYKPKKFEYMEKNTEGFGQCKKKYEGRNIIIDVSKVFPFKSRESQDKNKHVYEDCPINFNRLSHLVYNKEREVKKN